MVGMIWLATLLIALLGTVLALRRRKGLCAAAPPGVEPPVSVLKPLKGADPGLRENLESFFQLEYSQFELLFCVASDLDPAVPVVEELRRRYPHVSSRLFVGAKEVGPNPKVNNLARAYSQANFDAILISDSNVRVRADYLRRKMARLTVDVGVVTAAVAGMCPTRWGGRLEATYLNTFYARGMHLAFATGNPCVIGKSMLFRRSVAARFGGFEALGVFLAEDYALGEEMRKLGLKVVLAEEPIEQHIGDYSFRAFWDRHLRWGRIRKSHAPAAFCAEPIFSPTVSFFLGAMTTYGFRGGALAVGAWAACDLALMVRMSRARLAWWMPLAWVARELLALPLWIAAASGNCVRWRGATLRLAFGGKIHGGDPACQDQPSSGEPRRARTKSRGITRGATGGLGRLRAILREG